ncbi:glycoside hydrolase superfamily [Gorgonomyces haynaldii]|nr:glycoside hydrolase superfamily [Gorgonomyces haynaldii]
MDTNPGMDSPINFIKRVNFNPSFFHLAEDFPLDFNKPPPVEIIDATNTNAMYYLTIYPTKLSGVTDTDINELVKQIAGYTNKGKQVFIRFGPEMNGSWFVYGQQPTAFKALWSKIVTATRANPLTAGKVAFVWAPNFGTGYPYPGGSSSITKDSADYKTLDTNGDGTLDAKDDPYTPYYPGDDVVDWVGLSVYWFGLESPWLVNVLPTATAFDDIIVGKNANGYNFYDMFSTKKNKPFMISETGTALHEYILASNAAVAPGPGELTMKQAFWRQYITNPASMVSKYPRIKALCLFEWRKPEEQTMRDFRITNKTEILNAFLQDFNPVKSSYLLAGNAGVPIPGTDNGKPQTKSAAYLMEPKFIASLTSLWLLAFLVI